MIKRIVLCVVAVILVSIVLAVTFAGCLAVKISNEHYSSADKQLINKNASEEAKRLMQFLASIYGKSIISGQYINEYEDFALPQFRENEDDPDSRHSVFKANELQAVHSVTGQYPALLGLDVSGIECDAKCFTIEQAIQWHNAGGIVTICWHWMIDNFDGKPRAFYTDKTKFNLKRTLANKNSAQYKGLIADIDKVANSLKCLQDANVPVLWRPLHEASGGWFWWGASGSKAYKELWDIVYDRMTNFHKLNNLIWVYNGQNSKWYVGDDKCDIIGDDPYYPTDGGKSYSKDKANAKRFKKCYKTSDKKMIAMTENDHVPDIETAFNENVKWLTFCTWCREFVCVYEPVGDERATKPIYASSYTSGEQLKKIYEDQRVITLEKLVASGEYIKL